MHAAAGGFSYSGVRAAVPANHRAVAGRLTGLGYLRERRRAGHTAGCCWTARCLLLRLIQLDAAPGLARRCVAQKNASDAGPKAGRGSRWPVLDTSIGTTQRPKHRAGTHCVRALRETRL